MAWHQLPAACRTRQAEADLMREGAYHAVRAELDAGAIPLARAVVNLRHAYRRADRFARSFDTQTGAPDVR